MEELSRLSLQVYIDKVELKTTIQNIIQNRFVEQKLLKINGFEVALEEFEDLMIRFNDSSISYGFISKLNINSSKVSGIGGKAKVKIELNTQYSINEEWQLKTKTYLRDHEWIEKPVMKLKILSIPSTGLLELLIGAFDDKMGSELDNIINKGSDLTKFLKPILDKLKNPLQIERISNFNFNIDPESLKFYMQDDCDKYIKVKVTSIAGLTGKIKEMESSKIISDLPRINIEDFQIEQSKLLIYSEISHNELSKIILKEVPEIDLKGRKVRVENIAIQSDTNRLNFELDLNGSLTGKFCVDFEPVLHKSINQLELTDLKFKLESNQFFLKTASWLFKKEIEKQMNKYSEVDMAKILNKIKLSINKKLKNEELYPGLYLTADISKIQLNAIDLLKNSIALQFQVDSDFSAQLRLQKSLTQT